MSAKDVTLGFCPPGSGAAATDPQLPWQPLMRGSSSVYAAAEIALLKQPGQSCFGAAEMISGAVHWGPSSHKKLVWEEGIKHM